MPRPILVKAALASFVLGAALETLLEKSTYNAHIEMARQKKLAAAAEKRAENERFAAEHRLDK